MEKALRVLIVLVITLSLSLFLGCGKKKLAVSSAEGEKGRGVSGYERTEEGADARSRDARLRDLESSSKRQGMAGVLPEEARAFEEEMIFFEYDSYELSSQARSTLEKKAIWLKNNPQYRLRIEGHCDERGTNEYNLALGDRRANVAKAYLVSLGVEGDRISTISYGEERPIDTRHTEEAYSKNRRAEFKLIK